MIFKLFTFLFFLNIWFFAEVLGSGTEEEERYKEYKKSIWPLELRISRSASRLERYSQTPIIILFGPSCSGKTSICKLLRSFLEYKEIDRNLSSFYIKELKDKEPMIMNNLLKQFKGNYEDVLFDLYWNKNYSEGLENNKIAYLSKAFKDCIQKKQYLSSVFKMYEEAFYCSERNEITILDLVSDTTFLFFQAMELNLFHSPVISCFVHCDTEIFASRVLNRNKKALIMNRLGETRLQLIPFKQLIISAKNTITPTEIDIRQKSLEDLEKILNFYIKEEEKILTENNKNYPNLRLSSSFYQKEKRNIINKFFNSPESYPKIVSHIVLNTSYATPEELRDILLHLLRQSNYIY